MFRVRFHLYLDPLSLLLLLLPLLLLLLLPLLLLGLLLLSLRAVTLTDGGATGVIPPVNLDLSHNVYLRYMFPSLLYSNLTLL